MRRPVDTQQALLDFSCGKTRFFFGAGPSASGRIHIRLAGTDPTPLIFNWRVGRTVSMSPYVGEHLRGDQEPSAWRDEFSVIDAIRLIRGNPMKPNRTACERPQLRLLSDARARQRW